MPKIQQLSPHVADLIAAGEVVERPASAAKELVENAMDAGAKNITVELQNGGMSFLRVTDDGCGMEAEDAETAFLRHATSKLREAADLEAIHTLGFRGEALAAISAVSRIDLLTKTARSDFGTSLHLEAGTVTERETAGCPNGTTIIVRDLFYNTPARMKFMKRDNVEASALIAAVERLSLAHPEVSLRVIKDGQEVLHTSGDGKLYSAVYSVLGRQLAKEMLPVSSHWEKYTLTGFVTRPTATRGNRSNQLFFVNGRHVRSKTMTAALEEAYRNQLMAGRYPSCVLHLHLPEHLVDVNVHPAKTEVKFINERDLFDCVRYGVQGALETASGRVAMSLPKQPPVNALPNAASGQTPPAPMPSAPKPKAAPMPSASPAAAGAKTVGSTGTRPSAASGAKSVGKQGGFRSMTAEDYRAFLSVMQEAPRVAPPKASFPAASADRKAPPEKAASGQAPVSQNPPAAPRNTPAQQEIPLASQTYRIVGEVLNTYIIVEEGQNVLLIDKHAAHERILFEKLRKRTEPIVGQLLLTPLLCEPEREEAAILMENEALLQNCGFAFSDYGGGTIAIRQIPADLDPEDAESTLNQIASDLKAGKRIEPEAMRDTLLHTIACKAAIKGGWHTDEKELRALVGEVLRREDLKYCPHGRPICVVLSAKQLERQFKRA